jgi:alpha-1,3-mannosyltransferase
LPEYEKYDGIKIFRVPFLELRWYNIAPDVINFVKDYDIIHVHSIGFFSDFITLTKFLHKKPIILNTHGGIFHTRYIQPLKNAYFNLWCRMVFKGVYKILADGDSDKRKFDEIANNVDIIPITVDTKKYAKIKRKPIHGRLLYVGRLSKNKRVDNLIKTFAFVKKKAPYAKLYIVGPAWQDLDKELKSLAKKLGVEKSVIFTGEVSDADLIDQIKNAQLFLFASEYEGRPVTLMEMMAVGLPMVVNDIDIFMDFVKDGENGFLVDYMKHKDAADKIVSVMNTDLSKISKAVKLSSKKYDWDVAIKRIEEIYSSSLNTA